MKKLMISSVLVGLGCLSLVAQENANEVQATRSLDTTLSQGATEEVAANGVSSVTASPVAPSSEVKPVLAEAIGSSPKVVQTLKTSAKKTVDAEIDAFCQEQGLTLGYVKGKDAFYIKGVERVLVNVKSPWFVKSRTLAYAKAYQNAVAEYVLLKYGSTTMEQYNTYFRDESSDRLDPSVEAKDAMARIEEKTALLTEAKLDEGLRKMGLTPTGSLVEKRNLARDAVARKSLKKAIGKAAGLLPIQTFEGWNEQGQYAVGVIVRGGVDTELLADAFRQKQRPQLSRPAAGLTVEEAMPSEAEIVSQFGVRMFFNKDGVPSLLSFGQWGSSYTGADADRAEAAMDHAREQAEAEADDQLTMFISSVLNLQKESERSEDAAEDVTFDANGVPTLAEVVKFVDKSLKASSLQGSDTMRGRVSVVGFPKVVTHPSGHSLAVCVRVWSFDQYEAMSRIPQTEVQKPTLPAVKIGGSGVSRGRAYDF